MNCIRTVGVRAPESLSLFSISLIGEVHIDVSALLDIYLIWFGFIVGLSHRRGGRGGGGYLLVQIIPTCLRGAYVEEGGGGV